MDGLNSRMDKTEEIISELEDRAVDTAISEQQRK